MSQASLAASSSSQSVLPTMNDYAFNLRQGLRDAAVASLTSLEEMINDVGYGWLDGYMEGVLQSGMRAPIAELMKTPSRTATTKKTRAGTAAARDRTEKVKGVNARLAAVANGSPMSKSPASSRQPFSPLQPRSLNVAPASPLVAKGATPVKSSKSSRGKGKTKVDASAKEPTEKKKRGRPPKKKAEVGAGAGEAGPMEVGDDTSGSSRSTGSSAPASQSISSTHTEAQAIASPPPPSQDVEVYKSPRVLRSAQSPTKAPAASITSQLESVKSPTRGQTNLEMPPTLVPQAVENVPTFTPSERPLDPFEQIAPISTTIPSAAPSSQPARHPQVRSSWLNKALGSGPIPAGDANGMRKSVVSGARPTQVDFAALRKSLVPPNGLKRKSGEGLPEEDDAENERRAGKAARVDFASQPTRPIDGSTANAPKEKPIFPRSTMNVASTEAASAKQPITQPQSDLTVQADLRKSVAPAGDSQRSDINKVTKALDELRERTLAREAAKAKMSLAPKTPAPATAASGFLKGIGNIGAGLGRSLGLASSTKSAEDEAARVQREIEEERLAELEAEEDLRKLIGDVNQEKAERPISGEDAVADIPREPIRIEPSEAQMELDEDENEDTAETEESMLADDGHEEEADQAADARQTLTELISTTPPGTPPRTSLHRATPQHPIRVDEERLQEPKSGVASKSAESAKPHDTEAAGDDSIIELDQDMVAAIGFDGYEEEVTAPKQVNTNPASLRPASVMSTASSVPSIPSSAASQNNLISQGNMLASKTLGVKPAVAPVKSVQVAQQAAKKDQMTAERRAEIKRQQEARKEAAAKRKAEEDRVRGEEEKKVKMAELEEKRRQRVELERRRVEREERMAQLAREKALKEEREAAAQRAAKLAEDEARRKKLAMLQKSTSSNSLSQLNRSQSNATFKKIAAPAAAQPLIKSKEPFKPTKQTIALSSSTAHIPASSQMQGQKMGPSGGFRTAENVHAGQPTLAQSGHAPGSTVSLVNPQQPRPLGPPSRPSNALAQNGAVRPSNAVQPASAILAQSRVMLQSQLDEKAIEMQSEEIELPDIASEYSDSDDEKEPTFKRPGWAESPALRAALEAQATRDPDELFGPIRPVSMEELFKVRTNKFRARTSSANWNGGDRLTRAEEVEYARRMGFQTAAGSGIGPSNLGQ